MGDRERLMGVSPAQFGETKLPETGPQLATLEAQAAGHRASSFRVWLHRFAVLAFVFFCAVLGVVLVVFPWRDEWINNALLVQYPVVQQVVASGFVRGLCSGLGLLDIWIGFWEAVHYHE